VPGLSLQPKLGLLPEWRTRHSADHRAAISHLILRANVNSVIERLTDSTQSVGLFAERLYKTSGKVGDLTHAGFITCLQIFQLPDNRTADDDAVGDFPQ